MPAHRRRRIPSLHRRNHVPTAIRSVRLILAGLLAAPANSWAAAPRVVVSRGVPGTVPGVRLPSPLLSADVRLISAPTAPSLSASIGTPVPVLPAPVVGAKAAVLVARPISAASVDKDAAGVIVASALKPEGERGAARFQSESPASEDMPVEAARESGFWPRRLGWKPASGGSESVVAARRSASAGPPGPRLSPRGSGRDRRESPVERIMKPYRPAVRGATALKVTAAALLLLNAQFIGSLVQKAIAQDYGSVALAAGLSLATLLAGAAVRCCGDLLQGKAAAGAVNDLRSAVFSRALQEPSFLAGGESPGVLASRIKDEPVSAEQLEIRLPVRRAAAAVTLVVSTALLFAVHPAAAAAVIISAGAVRALARAYGRATKALFEDYQGRAAELNAHLVDVLENADTVTSFGKQEREAKRLRGSLERIRTILARSVDVGARWRSFEELSALPLSFPGAFVIALAFGLPVGAAVMAALYAGYAYGALGELSEVSSLSSQHAGTLSRVRSLLEKEPTVRDETAVFPLSGEVAAEGLTYAYGGGAPVLKGRSFRLPAGSFTVLAGPSGSGKSTLIRLLAGLDRPGAGRLLIDGVDADRLASEAFRRQIGYVPQDAGIIQGTLRDNLKYGRPEASDAELESFVRSLGAGFLLEDRERFPLGLDTPVGPQASGISGGQAQLIALLRALFSGPRLVLLDEPTASMDAAMESVVLAILRDLRAGRHGPPPTIVMITHRPQLAAGADLALKLD